MHSTREVIGLLAEANPDTRVDEERIRRALRTGKVQAPTTIAGRFAWSDQDLEGLALALGLRAPELECREGSAAQ